MCGGPPWVCYKKEAYLREEHHSIHTITAMKFLLLTVFLAASALAEDIHAPIHAPSYHPAPIHKPAPSYHPAPYKEPEYGPPHYEYKYGIDAYDAYGNPVYYGQNEARDGYSTIGEC